ncbi:MAG: response regulator [Methylococcales bacterium]|nr:response regulator [Methylococcales bacterium]
MICYFHDIKKANIMVIDDEEINLEIIDELLNDEGFSSINCFSDPKEAIKHYRQFPPDLVLLDLNMPVMNGFEVAEQFQIINHSPPPPILIITALADRTTKLKSLDSGAKDILSKPFDDQEVTRRVRNLIEMHLAHKKNLHYSKNLEHIVKTRTQELLETQNEMIESLGLAAEYRDNETATHTIRVGLYTQALAIQLGLNDKEANQLKLASPLHDIGKIGIPDNVLLKKGKLDTEEWVLMKKHAQFGYNILKNSKSLLLKNAGIIALTHHEKWDGNGYPAGLHGSEIHLYGRITAIADVFDALTMSRPYKKAWPIEDAIQLINDEAGKHFDPSLVESFNQIIDKLLTIRKDNSD